MKKIIVIILCFSVFSLLWYGVWRLLMADNVAQVDVSIHYQNQQFKTVTPTIVLKAESVEAAGFPLGFRVRVVRPVLSMIDGHETFAISLPSLELARTDATEGRYRVILPARFNALYAKDGAAPENYDVTMDAVPPVMLRAQGDSQQCSTFPGAARCAAVKADTPLISYAVATPKMLTLHMALNGDSRDATFELTPMVVPVFRAIPKTMDRPLQIFVGMLREALVFKTGLSS